MNIDTLYVYTKHLYKTKDGVLRAVSQLYDEVYTDDAFDIADKYMKKFPQSQTPYDIVGNFYSALADSANALQYWKSALKRSPGNIQLSNKIKAYSREK